MAFRLSAIFDFSRKKAVPAFLLGEYSGHGWWGYFLYSLSYQDTRSGSLMLIAASLVFYRAGQSTRVGAKHYFFCCRLS